MRCRLHIRTLVDVKLTCFSSVKLFEGVCDSVLLDRNLHVHVWSLQGIALTEEYGCLICAQLLLEEMLALLLLNLFYICICCVERPIFPIALLLLQESTWACPI